MTRALLQKALDALETGGFMKKLQAAIALRAELAKLEQEPRPPNCGTGHCSCIECHDPAYRAMVRGEAQPAQDGVWYRVVDEALVCAHIGVANITDDYATAQKKLNELICWSIQVDRDLARPAQEPLTDFEIARCDKRECGVVWSWEDKLEFARAIEAAHGIGSKA